MFNATRARVLGLTVEALLIVLETCSAPQPTATPLPPTATPVGKGKVDVGGYGLYITCSGEGSPTVVLDSDLGDGWVIWGKVIGEIPSHFSTRVCAYDRAGLAGSDPAPSSPRTNQDMMEDLHTLLVNANIPGPYVLVAHGTAGLTSRLYADQYPQEVVGMVWVDIIHPDFLADELSLLSPESPDEPSSVRDLRQWLVTLHDDPMQIAEQWDCDTSAVQVRATGSLGSIPLVVLTRDVTDSSMWMKWWGYGFPLELAESLDRSWLQRQEELAELSSNSTHIIVEDSDHVIQIDQPGAVVDAIKRVVESVRGE